MSYPRSIAALVGLTVKSVTAKEEHAKLVFEDGRTADLDLYGDCCSHSYFADPKQFDELVGRKILAAEHREGGETTETYDVIRSKFLVLTTDKGHVTIDWRNASNGYYDGELSVTVR